MMDYSVSGEFGQVKLFNTCVNSGRFTALDHISRFGWHKVNEKYQISRSVDSGCNHLLLITLSGRGNVTVDGKSFAAVEQTVTVIPGNTNNAYGGVQGEEWEFYWIHYYGTNADRFTKDITQNGQYVFHLDGKILDSLMDRLQSGTPVGTEQELKEAQLLSKILYLLLHESVETEPKTEKETDVVKAMIAQLQQTQGEFHLSALTDHFHYSKEHIIRLFKSVTGMTPYHYWQRLRLEECCMLLESTSKPMSEIALQCGFANVNNFSKQFKKAFGMTPTKYKQLYGLFQN